MSKSVDLQLRRQYVKLADANDLAGVRSFLLQHLELVNDPTNAARMITRATQVNKLPLVQLLVELGVSVNAHDSGLFPVIALQSACNLGYTELAKWLVEQGSEINFGQSLGGLPYCPGLAPVIMEQNVELVRVLVEAGAELCVRDRTGATPLDWAVRSGNQKLVAFITQHGGVTAGQARNAAEPLEEES